MKNEILFYDPRRGKNYDFDDRQTKSKFSSVESNLFVVECYGDIDWRLCSDLITISIDKAGKHIFAILDPWPNAESIKQTIIEVSLETIYAGDSICAYLPNARSIGPILEHAYTKDPHGWGGLCFGSCSAKFEVPTKKGLLQNTHWNSGQILMQIERLGCVLCLDELKHSLYLAKISDPCLEGLCDRLRAHLLQSDAVS